MKLGKREWFHDVLNIPEGQAGEFAIVHKKVPAGKPVPTSNIRVAFHRGQTRKQVVFDKPTKWHLLTENGGVWMSDYPIEQIQIDEELKGFSGRVLVGGLGLGYAATALTMKPRVKEIVVVEKSPEVVQLVAPYISHRKVSVVNMDLFEYLTAAQEKGRAQFDFGFYDIWAADSETTFHTVVMPLRRLSRGVVRVVTCWNESVMRSQLMIGLSSRLLYALATDDEHAEMGDFGKELTVDRFAEGVPEDDSAAPYINWARPFWQWVNRMRPTLHPNILKQVATRKAADYTKFYGIMPDDFMEGVLLR